jgi:flagellar hook-associated protein 3 FlgL
MTRVSENSSTASLRHALNRTKAKMEDLQLKGSTLRSVVRPSDNPLGSVEGLQLKSSRADNGQFMRNSDHALLSLNVTETALDSLTEIMVKAKEIAIAQASDFYNPEVRKAVSNEVNQLRNQAISLANKRVGQRYIFGGFNTLSTPFTAQGEYKGDSGKITVEVSKDFFVPINLHGEEVFFASGEVSGQQQNPLKGFPEIQNQLKDELHELPDDVFFGRELASVGESPFERRDNLFSLLETLYTALNNDDPELIQSTLERFDGSIDRLITLRTQVGSIVNSIENTRNIIDAENITKEERISQLLDADIAELFSDISKQQAILQTTYKSSQGVLNSRLIDFLR